jgi:hypothetical protein
MAATLPLASRSPFWPVGAGVLISSSLRKVTVVIRIRIRTGMTVQTISTRVLPWRG